MRKKYKKNFFLTHHQLKSLAITALEYASCALTASEKRWAQIKKKLCL